VSNVRKIIAVEMVAILAVKRVVLAARVVHVEEQNPKRDPIRDVTFQ
jgi:hypothetical protein